MSENQSRANLKQVRCAHTMALSFLNVKGSTSKMMVRSPGRETPHPQRHACGQQLYVRCFLLEVLRATSHRQTLALSQSSLLQGRRSTGQPAAQTQHFKQILMGGGLGVEGKEGNANILQSHRIGPTPWSVAHVERLLVCIDRCTVPRSDSEVKRIERIAEFESQSN